MRSGLLEAVEKPLDAPLWQADDGELLADLGDLLLVADRLQARLAATVSEAADRGLADQGERVRSDLLVRDRSVASLGRSASRQLARRSWVRRELPAVAALHDRGAVSTAFVDAAGRGLDRLPAECRPVVDEVLAGPASSCDPADVVALIAQIQATVDPDGATARSTHLDELSRISLSPIGNEGAYALDGVLYGTDAEKVHAMIHTRADRLRRAGDTRTPGQRRAAALFDICGIADRATADPAHVLPAHGGDTHVTIIAPAAAWLGEPGAPAATTSNGNLIDPGQLTAIRCSTPNPDILIATSTADGAPNAHNTGELTDAELLARSLAGLVASPAAYRLVPLAYGRASRKASPAQRQALIGRDRHCVYPGCQAPPWQCQSHHLREYDADEGNTDLPNMALVCDGDHIRIHRQNQHLHPPWCVCHATTVWTLHPEAPDLP